MWKQWKMKLNIATKFLFVSKAWPWPVQDIKRSAKSDFSSHISIAWFSKVYKTLGDFSMNERGADVSIAVRQVILFLKLCIWGPLILWAAHGIGNVAIFHVWKKSVARVMSYSDDVFCEATHGEELRAPNYCNTGNIFGCVILNKTVKRDDILKVKAQK